MENKKYYQIEGHEGKWVHKKTWISELGYVMVQFYNEEKKVSMNMNMGTLEEALKSPYDR
jgi:hypothetical protein